MLCKIIRYSLGSREAQAYIYESYDDGLKHLKISTDIYCLETGIVISNSKYYFGGEVAGNTSEILTRIKAIADILSRNNYQCHFEIYDDNLEFVDEYPKLK